MYKHSSLTITELMSNTLLSRGKKNDANHTKEQIKKRKKIQIQDLKNMYIKVCLATTILLFFLTI